VDWYSFTKAEEEKQRRGFVEEQKEEDETK
jgi:hypothetical protein